MTTTDLQAAEAEARERLLRGHKWRFMREGYANDYAAAVRATEAARYQGLAEAAQMALTYFEVGGLVSTDEEGYVARDALRVALAEHGETAARYVLLCDESGVVLLHVLNALRPSDAPYRGEPFQCSGSFTTNREVVWCSNPIHVLPAALAENPAPAARYRDEAMVERLAEGMFHKLHPDAPLTRTIDDARLGKYFREFARAALLVIAEEEGADA